MPVSTRPLGGVTGLRTPVRVKHPAFRPGGVVHYRRRGGTLFEGHSPIVEEEPGPVYSSASFVRDAPDWARVFHHVASSGVGLIITTNGLRMAPAVVRVLQQIRPLEVRVSFDGGPLLHEHVRGPGTYSKAMKGLLLLIEAGLRATARLTLCQGADTELRVLFSDLSDIGVGAIKVAVVKPVGRAATEAGRHLLGYLPDQRAITSLKVLGEAHNLQVQLSADDFPVSLADANDPKLRDDAEHRLRATAHRVVHGCMAKQLGRSLPTAGWHES